MVCGLFWSKRHRFWSVRQELRSKNGPALGNQVVVASIYDVQAAGGYLCYKAFHVGGRDDLVKPPHNHHQFYLMFGNLPRQLRQIELQMPVNDPREVNAPSLFLSIHL